MARSPDPLGAIVYVRAIVPVAESSLRHISVCFAVEESFWVSTCQKKRLTPRKGSQVQMAGFRENRHFRTMFYSLKKLMNDIILNTSLRGPCALGVTADVELLLGTGMIHAMGPRNEQYTKKTSWTESRQRTEK